jgi:glycosyltransferase involved in cell wall biosynthesis
MRAAIYNPYLDTLGGGEKYTVTFAMVLAENGYKVDIQWKNEAIKNKLEKRFGLTFKNIEFVRDIKRGDGYDVCFWVSDGSIPLLRARKNILHFQVPFKDVNGRSLLNKMKMFRIKKVICNSNFTKRFIDEEFGVNSVVIYPPVTTDKIKPKRKENIILYIGRFSQLEQAKNQHILVDVFKKFFNKGYKDWKLILAGGVEVGVGDYLTKIKRKSKGYPIEIIESPKYLRLVDLYGRAKLFWSAVGFDINESKEPKKVEHFGITVVEAMSGGCVPVIFNAGGHKEIVSDGKNGFLWEKTSELVRITKRLVSDNKYLRDISKEAVQRSKCFSYERYAEEIEKNLQ